MKSVCRWRFEVLLIVVSCLVLSGCVFDSLNQYAEDDYGSDRADRLCHPTWDCQQGKWERVGKSEIDMIVDYAQCEGNLEPYGEWLRTTVSLGLEAKRCMEMKGYALKFPNPLRR